MTRTFSFAVLIAVFAANSAVALAGFDLPRLNWPNDDVPPPVTRGIGQ